MWAARRSCIIIMLVVRRSCILFKWSTRRYSIGLWVLVTVSMVRMEPRFFIMVGSVSARLLTIFA
jgi:hypothetical protein